MRYDPDKRRRRSMRLKDYDYRQTGAYFVTICTHQREWLFGEVIDDVMQLNDMGQIAAHEWLKTSELRSNVELDAFVVMPNHLHGIVVINEDGASNVGTRRAVSLPTPRRFGTAIAGSLSTIIGAYKSAVTKAINLQQATPGGVIWQKRFHEVIIRNETMLNNIRLYIDTNPAKWADDPERG